MRRASLSSLPFPLLAVCFFASGFTGLVYELAWLRRLQLTFGSTTYSVTAILAAFMAGLGFGSYLLGRAVDRRRWNGVRVYALLELCIGLYAAVSLPLLGVAEGLFAAIQSGLALGHGGATLLKFALAFPVLALPAGLMGGTLPALVRGVLHRRSSLGGAVGWLYGLNTAGAALGTGLSGFVLIEAIGLWKSVALAGAINISVGALVLALLHVWQDRPEGDDADEPSADADATTSDDDPPADPAPSADPPEPFRRHLKNLPVLFCAASVVLTGALSMLYEVAWTRMLSLTVGSSTYAFTIVLSIFLVGIALGSMLYGALCRLAGPNHTPRPLTLAWLLFGLAVYAALTLAAIPHLPLLMLWVNQLPGATFTRVMLFQTGMALAVLLVPTLILGAALPLSMAIISRALGLGAVGRDVGGVYLANTGGTIVGSVLTGFALIPLLGTQTTLVAGLCANIALAAVGLALFCRGIWRRAVFSSLAVAVALWAVDRPAWPAWVFDHGLHYQHRLKPAEDPVIVQRRLRRQPSRLLFFEEGVNATISVRAHNDAVTLFVNGKPDASTKDDMPHQSLLGLVPALAHPKPRTVGLVGWGSGVTAHTLTFFPEIERIDVAEIEPAVLRASEHFSSVNGNAHRHPKVHVVVDDARSYFLTTDRTYDLIISQPSNPWMVGVANLFSEDFYRLVKDRLARGGVLAQWLQLYLLDSRSVAMVLRTFVNAFPHAQVWTSDAGDLILLGSQQPLAIDPARIRAAYRRDRRIALHADAFGPGPQPDKILGCYLIDREVVKALLKAFPDETTGDDHPRLEYRAVRTLYRKTHRHMADLWKAKMTTRRVMPPSAVGKADPGAVLAGAVHMLHGIPKLRYEAVRWANKLAPNHPMLGLEEARARFGVGSPWAVRDKLKALRQTNDADLAAEAAVLEARLLVRVGKPAEALEVLDTLDGRRPVAEAWFRTDALVALRRHADAWPVVERLFALARRGNDADIKRLDWYEVYRVVDKIITGTKAYARGIRLIGPKPPEYGAGVFRLLSLLDAHLGNKDTAGAVKVMDRIMALGLVGFHQLKACEKVYRRAKLKEKAARCTRLRRQLGDLPTDQSLWPGR